MTMWITPYHFMQRARESNELMAHTYSYLYGLPTTGLRFFTVYGPWGRPDMALFKFTRAILAGEAIEVFNFGRHQRDFTFIDDIIKGVMKAIAHPAKPNKNWRAQKPDPATSFAAWQVYNIGNNEPITLLDFIATLEKVLGKKAKISMLPLQPGDMQDTFADINDFGKRFNYKPSTTIMEGIEKFVEWYSVYHR